MSFSGIHTQIHNYLEDTLPFHLDILKQMVDINSFTTNHRGVNRLGKLTAQFFAELGFIAETIPSTNPMYGDHVVLTKTGRSGRKIGLVSHLDTVFSAAEEEANDFHWRPEGNRIYGPGTVDIKGGTLIIYMMMAAMRTYLPQLFEDITWVILLDSSEETEAEDFGRLCLDQLAGECLACLVFEGGGMHRRRFKIVTVRKGMAIYHIMVEGKAAHAGSAHPKGANAIVQMADIIQQVNALTDYEQAITFNVGTIAGGTVINRVPHLALSSVEMRAFSPEVYNNGMNRMLALNNHPTVRSPNGQFACRVNIEVVRTTPPWPRNEETENLFLIWHQAAQQLGFEAIREERGGLSDGNHIWHAIPTIDGLGPSGGNSHCSERSPDGSKDQEYCLATSFVPKTLLNIAALQHLLKDNLPE